jgi:hypothetical protein
MDGCTARSVVARDAGRHSASGTHLEVLDEVAQKLVLCAH